MGIHHYTSSKHRAWTIPAKVDRLLLPRLILQSAKLRARKPMPCHALKWILHPRVKEDAATLRTPPPPAPYPAIPKAPLVAPEAWRSLPSTLERPPMPEVNPEHIASTQPGYAGIPLKHVRENWTWMGYKALGLYQKLYVDPPKTALPPGYNVIMKDLGLATCATHVFGVYSYAPSAELGDPVSRQIARSLKYRREVALFPTHAAIWAAHCSRLPRITKEDNPIKLVRKPGEKEAASCVRLPVVPIPIPYPAKFFAIELYVYTLLGGLFIGHLLPCSEIKYFMPPEAKVGDSFFTKLVNDLANFYNLYDLCRLARNVYGAYQNMIVLGMVDDGIWEALDFAWQTVRKAMEIVDERERNASA